MTDTSLPLSLAFTGYLRPPGEASDPQGTVLRVVVNTPVPCTLDGVSKLGKARRVVLTVVGIQQLGWSRVPYKKARVSSVAKKGGKGDDARSGEPATKPLFERGEVRDGVLQSLRAFNFFKASNNMDRGERDDASVSELRVGHTLVFYLADHMYEERNTFSGMPPGMDTIPLFSMLDIVVMATHNQTDGYGLKLQRVWLPVAGGTMYSHARALERLPGSMAEARALLDLENQQHMKNVLEQGRTVFYARAVGTGAFTEDLPSCEDFVKVVAGDGAPVLLGDDPVLELAIAKSDLCRALNHGLSQLAEARTLFDFACAAGAMRLYVVHDQWQTRGKPGLPEHRAVPVLDVRALLPPLDGLLSGSLASDAEAADVGLVDFPVPWTVPGVSGAIVLRVAAKPFVVLAGSGGTDGVPCADLPLVSSEFLPEGGDDEDGHVNGGAGVSAFFPEGTRLFRMQFVEAADAESLLLDFAFAVRTASGCAPGGGGSGRMNYRKRAAPSSP